MEFITDSFQKGRLGNKKKEVVNRQRKNEVLSRIISTEQKLFFFFPEADSDIKSHS